MSLMNQYTKNIHTLGNLMVRNFAVKPIPSMTKLAHVRLNLKDFNSKLPLIK